MRRLKDLAGRGEKLAFGLFGTSHEHKHKQIILRTQLAWKVTHSKSEWSVIMLVTYVLNERMQWVSKI